MFTGGPFTQGYLTGPQAAELNQLWAKVRALDAITGVPPVVIQRGPGGQPIIGGGPFSRWLVKGKLNGTMSFGGSATMSVWAKLAAVEADTGEDITVYDWHLSSGRTIAAGTQVTAGWDAASRRYYVAAAAGSLGSAVGGGGGGKIKGVLDGDLDFEDSATMSVYENVLGTETDTGENVTVFDWLLSSGQTVTAGTKVTAFYEPESDRWYCDGAQCP